MKKSPTLVKSSPTLMTIVINVREFDRNVLVKVANVGGDLASVREIDGNIGNEIYSTRLLLHIRFGQLRLGIEIGRQRRGRRIEVRVAQAAVRVPVEQIDHQPDR